VSITMQEHQQITQAHGVHATASTESIAIARNFTPQRSCLLFSHTQHVPLPLAKTAVAYQQRARSRDSLLRLFPPYVSDLGLQAILANDTTLL